MGDLHEAEFIWPHTDALNVIVTGTFDNWSGSVHLTKFEGGFKGKVRVPWGERTLYKFIVDGLWTNHEDHPTEPDPAGNINNVYIAPSKPMAAPKTNGNGNAVSIPEPALSEKTLPNGKPSSDDVPTKEDLKPITNGTNGLLATNGTKTPDSEDNSDRKSFVADIADTIAAREGASTPLGYVVSGIGAAIGNVVGVDPINGPHIAIPTPKDAEFPDIPSPTEEKLEKPAKEPLDLAPNVPVEVVPVNAAENNMVPSPEPVTQADTPAETPVTDTAADVVPAPAPVPVETDAPAVEASTHSPITMTAPIAAIVPNGDVSSSVVQEDAEKLATETKPIESPTEPDTAKDLPPPPVLIETPASPISPTTNGVHPSIDQVNTPEKPAASEAPIEAPQTPPKLESKTEAATLSPPSPTTPPPSAPSTPQKSHGHRFPSFSSRKSMGSVESSPLAEGNNGTVSSKRKKRSSIFGKISQIFKHEHKDKEAHA